MKHRFSQGLFDAARLAQSSQMADAAAALQRSLAESCAGSAGQPWARLAASAGAGLALKAAARAASLRPAKPARAAVSVPAGAQFLAESHSSAAGSRPYKLYVPSGYDARVPAALVVMLHGCTQSPDDFAAGTRMNEAAEAQNCLVAYPGQTQAANAQKCWNWFDARDQQRGGGEPAVIAGITQDIMRAYAVDPRRVYVAGLSAGGAAAAIMGQAYPELYAAVGVHSGLACGAASDVASAFAAMQHGGAGKPAPKLRPAGTPTIVFHGTQDRTVNPRNADAVLIQAASGALRQTQAQDGRVVGGHAYRRTCYVDGQGTPIEHWAVYGAGHAWSGGNEAGSYTDPHGPDATAAMLRFFMEHPQP